MKNIFDIFDLSGLKPISPPKTYYTNIDKDFEQNYKIIEIMDLQRRALGERLDLQGGAGGLPQPLYQTCPRVRSMTHEIQAMNEIDVSLSKLDDKAKIRVLEYHLGRITK